MLLVVKTCFTVCSFVRWRGVLVVQVKEEPTQLTLSTKETGKMAYIRFKITARVPAAQVIVGMLRPRGPTVLHKQNA